MSFSVVCFSVYLVTDERKVVLASCPWAGLFPELFPEQRPLRVPVSESPETAAQSASAPENRGGGTPPGEATGEEEGIPLLLEVL